MPAKNSKLLIRLDLLKPQSSPEKLPLKFLRWLFSSGRLVFIFVEALVLLAFIARFKFDADLAAKKETIDQEISFIQSLKPYEILIKQTQAKLSTIDTFHTNTTDYTKILKGVADQTPSGVKILTLSLTKNTGKITVSINAEAQNNNDLSSFLAGLKEGGFSQVTLTSIGLEQGLTRFVINADSVATNTVGKNL